MMNTKMIGLAKFALNTELQKIRNFDKLTDQLNFFIKQKANDLSEQYNKDIMGEDYFYKLVHYIFKTNRRWNNNLSSEVKLSILLLTVDPEFKIYEIYEDNCNIKDMKNAMIENFGFFEENLIKLENIYLKRFPNSTDYSFTKKLEPQE